MERGSRIMLFWRAKNAKQASDDSAAEASPAAATTTAGEVPAEPAPAEATGDAASTQVAAKTGETESKIVTLVPSRLSERLAQAKTKAPPPEVLVAAQAVPQEIMSQANTAADANSKTFIGRDRALAALRSVMSDTDAASHVLVVGTAGTGRRGAVLSIAREIAKTRPEPADWIYAATSRNPGVLNVYAVPHGTSERFVRDVNDALAKSSAMLARLQASDSHQMTLAVLEEEHRQRGEGGIEHLRQRAEAQNIALVKTTEGFVLAPMHEGRVVRADVFRALPEALQRDVEAKVTALESDLQALLGALPGHDVAIDDRHLALSQQTAERAVKPNLAVARKLFSCDAAVTELFDAIESDWTRRATDIVRQGGPNTVFAGQSLQAVTAGSSGGAPVVLAHGVSARDLFGEIGIDMAGAVAVRPGYLAKANGGYLIIDAWRLAAEPQGWAALSAALETNSLQPLASAGVAVTAEPVPLQLKLILIAERRSLARLKAIDPRIEQYFGAVVSLGEAAPREMAQ
jgi:predicted ATP-dependent protease